MKRYESMTKEEIIDVMSSGNYCDHCYLYKQWGYTCLILPNDYEEDEYINCAKIIASYLTKEI